MSEWNDVRKKLPKAKLLAISTKKVMSFYARFRCANFMRLDIGRITLLVRMPGWKIQLGKYTHICSQRSNAAMTMPNRGEARQAEDSGPKRKKRI